MKTMKRRDVLLLCSVVALVTLLAGAPQAQAAPTEVRFTVGHTVCSGTPQFTFSIGGSSIGTYDATGTDWCSCEAEAHTYSFSGDGDLSLVGPVGCSEFGVLVPVGVYISYIRVEVDRDGGEPDETYCLVDIDGGGCADQALCDGGYVYVTTDTLYESTPTDTDGDGTPDCTDTDDDNDGVLDAVDNCPLTPNPGQEDPDGDGVGSACDNCPAAPNPGQEDGNDDGMGDVCQDTDGDGVLDAADNCPTTPNPGQEDADGDGVGNACEVQAICVPWKPSNPTIPHSTYSTKEITLKGIARNGPTEYRWDFGDGSSTGWTAVSNPYNLGVKHTYTGAVGTLFIATLYVRAGADMDQDTYRVLIRESTDLGIPAHLDVRIDMAIDEGLWYLHTNQIRTTEAAGAPGYGQPSGHWDPSYYPVAAAGTSVDAFQLHGSRVNGDYENDPYVETVQRGLNYLLMNTHSFAIGTQSAGDPDTNGNGIGLVTNQSDSATDYRQTYIGGICAVTLASSGSPNRVAAVGGANVYGRTYRDIVQDMVDFWAWGQIESASACDRGGWRYYANFSGSDMSTAQWAPLAMLAAEQNMGSVVPQFVRDELTIYVNAVQYTALDNDNGSYYYNCYTLWANITKAAAGTICHEFLGTPLNDARVQRALGFVYRHWNDTGTSWDRTTLLGNSYGMYGLMKACRIPEPDILRITEYDYAASPPAQTANSFDWYYTPTGQSQQGLASYCVATQQSDGSWDDTVGSNAVQDALCTGWRILVLLKGVTIIPPEAVICECGENEYDLDESIPLDGTCSYHPDSKRNIVLYEWDLDNDGVYDDATGTTASIPGGFPAQGYYPVGLRVTDDNPANLGGPQTGIHICQIFVHPPCLNPRAVIGGPYQGFVGTPLTLNASASSDPDTDSANLTFNWDLDADGQFDDATGVTVQHTWNAPYTGVIGLRVTDECPDGTDQTNWDGFDVAYTTVEIGNHAPVSDPGGPYVAPPNATITLDGSGSYDIDPGDSIASYAWDLDNDGDYDDSSAQNPSVTVGGTPGTVYPICLRVTDRFGETGIGCTTVTVISTVAINIDIYPNRVPNRVILSRNYTLYVAVLGSANFDVATINSSTVKFGKTGTEASPIRAPLIRDLNADGFADAMYGFMTNNCGFALSDTQGILKGSTASGTDVEGSDSVLVLP